MRSLTRGPTKVSSSPSVVRRTAMISTSGDSSRASAARRSMSSSLKPAGSAVAAVSTLVISRPNGIGNAA